MSDLGRFGLLCVCPEVTSARTVSHVALASRSVRTEHDSKTLPFWALAAVQDIPTPHPWKHEGNDRRLPWIEHKANAISGLRLDGCDPGCHAIARCSPYLSRINTLP
jgi:hypothetical protein